MSSEAGDSFWIASKAWRHSLMEGIRVAAIAVITIFLARAAAWIFHSDQDLVSWLSMALLLGLFIGLPLLPIFAVWTRWDIWRGNQVRPK